MEWKKHLNNKSYIFNIFKIHNLNSAVEGGKLSFIICFIFYFVNHLSSLKPH